MRLVFFLYMTLLINSLAFTQSFVPTPPTTDIIRYKYYYTSIILLDPSVNIDERRNWYFVYRQQIDRCMKGFVYPEDFNTPTATAMGQYKQECHYKTILEINNFENNLYFGQKKPFYNIYNTNPVFANILGETLSCENCSLYPNRNSEITFISTPTQKVRSFTLNSTQQEIFSQIFALTHDNTRIVDASKETINHWIQKINAAPNRSTLKLIWDDFVNHIEFEPIETKKQIIDIGEKVYSQGKTQE